MLTVLLLLLQAFGWRSMFVLLAGLSTLVILPLLLLCVPETLQYKVVQRLTKQQPVAALKMAEAPTILGQVRKQQLPVMMPGRRRLWGRLGLTLQPTQTARCCGLCVPADQKHTAQS